MHWFFLVIGVGYQEFTSMDRHYFASLAECEQARTIEVAAAAQEHKLNLSIQSPRGQYVYSVTGVPLPGDRIVGKCLPYSQP